MEPLDPALQLRSSELPASGPGSVKHDGQTEAAAYPPAYPDEALLHFASSEHALVSPSLPFSPADPSFQYALTANAIATAQHHQSHLQHRPPEDSKKDIKRRTKTGCLTCRKRRIKCDESQPACNNCRKSKRECQGYDPLFRNQQSPTAIQPASGESKAALQQQQQQQQQQQRSSSQSAYPAPPAGYAAVQSPTYPDPSMAHFQNEPATFDFSAAIDPALQNHTVPNLNSNQPVSQGSLFASNQDAHQVDVKPSTVEELMQIGAPFTDIPISSSMSDEKKVEIKALFNYYSPGLNKFLETQWFQQHGYTHLQKTPSLLEKYATLLSRMEFTADQHPYENQINLTVEAHIIWGTLELSKTASEETRASTADSTQLAPPEHGGHIDIHESALRLSILKALITNTYLEPAFLGGLSRYDSVAPAGFNALSKQLLGRERKFWKHTAKFLTLDVAKTSAEAIDAALLDMRGLLESKENRDIMYSVAVMRIWPRRLMDREQQLKNEGQVIPQLDENDVKKVDVAKAFLTQQAGGRGTTPASQRICGMILRGWHPPPFEL